MGTGDNAYVYGSNNGLSYYDDDSAADTISKTHWDPRIEVKSIAGVVQVGVVPPSDKSTDVQGLWDPSDGQYLSLSRDGLNRLIEALQEAGAATYGRDRW